MLEDRGGGLRDTEVGRYDDHLEVIAKARGRQLLALQTARIRKSTYRSVPRSERHLMSQIRLSAYDPCLVS